MVEEELNDPFGTGYNGDLFNYQHKKKQFYLIYNFSVEKN